MREKGKRLEEGKWKERKGGRGAVPFLLPPTDTWGSVTIETFSWLNLISVHSLLLRSLYHSVLYKTLPTEDYDCCSTRDGEKEKKKITITMMSKMMHTMNIILYLLLTLSLFFSIQHHHPFVLYKNHVWLMLCSTIKSCLCFHVHVCVYVCLHVSAWISRIRGLLVSRNPFSTQNIQPSICV